MMKFRRSRSSGSYSVTRPGPPSGEVAMGGPEADGGELRMLESFEKWQSLFLLQVVTLWWIKKL